MTYPGPSTTSYVYDAFGNRTSMTVGANTTTYAYDDNDRITSVTPPSASPIAYTWDDNGSLEDRGSDEFVWDYEDRLVETTVNSVTTEFAYRGDGLRDSRTVGMNTTTFTWDIAAGIPVVLDDGNRYIYGAHGLIAQVEGSDWYYVLSDGLGSTMAITDDVGTVVRDYTYDVFGEVTGGSGTVDSEFQFAGEQVDGSTGLQYLRARYYDMESGTFISRDPMAAGPGWLEHPFAYGMADPINRVDPLGTSSFIPPVLCVFGFGICKDKDAWPEPPCGSVGPGVAPCLGPTRGEPPIVIGLDQIQLLGEYLYLGTRKFDVGRQRGDRITELKSDDPLGDSWDVFQDLARRNGATPVEASGGRWKFRTKSGLEVSWRLGSDAQKTPTVHIQNARGGEFKLKFTKRK